MAGLNMSTKPNPTDRLPFRQLPIAVALMLVIPGAMAKPAAQEAPHAPVWEQWQAVAEGFMARRRVPARLEESVEARRAPETQPHDLERCAAVGVSGRMTAASTALSAGFSTLPVSSAWLYTVEGGLYGLSLSDLAAQTGIGIRQLREDAKMGRLGLVNEGQAVAWYFDALKDRLLFTGEAYENFQTQGNAYLLRQAKSADPLRMTVRGGMAPWTNGLATPFREVLHFEEEGDMMFFTWINHEDPDGRYWFWDYLYGADPSKTQLQVPLRVPNPATQGQARLRVGLQGFTDLHSGNDHSVVAKLNGVQVGAALSWDGVEAAELVADFDQRLLKANGENTLTLLGSQGGQMLAWVEVSYNRLPVADKGQVRLRKVAGGVQAASGFAGKNILVIESPVRNAVIRKDVRVYKRGGGWAVAFKAAAGKDYLIAETSAPLKPVVDARAQADLMAGQNEADYLIIAAREFSATAEALAEHRHETYGAVKIAWLDDIYKTFGAGREDPFAIGRFMDHARTQWASAPSAVVLVGKGSLDRKDTMGYGDNFLPVLMTSNPWALAESDARLLGDETGGMDFAIGRLAITNDAEGLAYVDKLKAHEAPVGAAAAFSAVVVADNPDKGGDFHLQAEGLAEQLLSLGSSPITKLYHSTQAVRTNLILSRTWDTGFVSYSGHGSASQIGNNTERFLTASDAANLGNSNYPVFAALSCAVGSDALPGTRSLASALVMNPQGGAIASLAPTGLSLDAQAHELGAAFIDRLYADRRNTVGDAVAGAKLDTGNEIEAFMAPIYSVVGDPGVYAR
jgi:hypothetical protein